MITGVNLGDVGTRIFLDCQDDLSLASSVQIHATRPDGRILIWPAVVDGTGVYYLTQAGDITQRGDWQLRAWAQLPAWRGFGDIETLRVG